MGNPVSTQGNETPAVCPVDGCDYSGPVESVAGHVSGKKDPQHDWRTLGYGGYYEYIREQKQNQHSSQTVLVHMTDSHIGRKKGGHYGKGWEVDCAAGFQKAIEAAISVDADAVVHTGDLFHNDTTNGITKDHKSAFFDGLGELLNAEIPFYFVLGDHERDEGKQVMNNFEKLDAVQSLNTTPALIGEHIALYGVDSQRKSWWSSGNFTPEAPPSGRTSILALHQSLEQFVNPDRAECDARGILQQTQSAHNFRFDSILVGQHHKDVRETVQGCQVLCGGATERISKRNFEPFIRVITAGPSSLSHRKKTLDI